MQTYGILYQETFTLVAKINSITILSSLEANLDWSLQLFDIKNTFLHGTLEKGVYMDLSTSFEDNLNDGKVCKLRKSSYGLNNLLEHDLIGSLSQFLNFGIVKAKGLHFLH